MLVRKGLVAAMLGGLALLPSACLEHDRGSRERLGVGSTSGNALTPSSAAAAAGSFTPPLTQPATPPTDTPCPDDPGAALRVIDATHCQVSRAILFGDKLDCLLSMHRITEVSVAGKPVGFRDGSIGSKSVYGRCGIRSGDVWTAVNGHSLATAEDALKIYPTLRQSDQLDIQLIRDNAPIELHIALSDRDSTSGGSTVAQTLDTPEPATRARAAESNNAFALALWAEAQHSITGNATLSPLSLFAGLSLTRLGAAGTTSSELAKTLRFEGPAATAYLATLHAIRPEPAYPESRAQLAARLFVDRGQPLDPAYVTRSRSLGEAVELLDFQHSPEQARRQVNSWVSEQTHAKISELVPPGGIAADTKLVLTNALSFSARWAKPFRVWETRAEPFHVSAKNAPNVPTLHSDESFGIGSAGGVKWLRLPYSGGRFAMTVVLPGRGQSLAELERALDAPTLASWLVEPPSIPASVSVPKFRVRTPEALSLSQVLRAMGINAAFAASSADFSPMTGATAAQDRFFIRDVFQQAVVEIDENGTEAAAASAFLHSASAQLVTQKPAEFRADRPFLFLISELEHDTLLFIGRVVNPATGARSH